MKMKTIVTLMLIIIPSYIALADIIPENHHYVEKCVKITNLSEFNDISLLGFVPGPLPFETYLISSTECLQKGYKLNTLSIYAVEKAYLLDKNITSIDWSKDNHSIKSNIQVDCGGGYVPNSDPTSAINQFYKIAGFTENTLVLYKWMEINKFNNGKPDSISTYNYDGDSTILSKSIILDFHLNQNISSIELYPNPIIKNFQIKFNNDHQGNITIKIFSYDGKVVSTLNKNKTETLLYTTIPVDNLSKGTYFVNIIMGEMVETRKIFIN